MKRLAALLLPAVLLPAAAPGPNLPLVAPKEYRSRVVAPHRGRALVVNFWATWCEPCREEMPDLIAASREFSRRGLDVVLVSADAPSATESVLRFLRDRRVPFPCFREDAADPQTFIDAVDPRWEGELPHTAIYSRDGALRISLASRQSRKQFENAFREALGSTASKPAGTPEPRAE